jgi:hypothetical protein
LRRESALLVLAAGIEPATVTSGGNDRWDGSARIAAMPDRPTRAVVNVSRRRPPQSSPRRTDGAHGSAARAVTRQMRHRDCLKNQEQRRNGPRPFLWGDGRENVSICGPTGVPSHPLSGGGGQRCRAAAKGRSEARRQERRVSSGPFPYESIGNMLLDGGFRGLIPTEKRVLDDRHRRSGNRTGCVGSLPGLVRNRRPAQLRSATVERAPVHSLNSKSGSCEAGRHGLASDVSGNNPAGIEE